MCALKMCYDFTSTIATRIVLSPIHHPPLLYRLNNCVGRNNYKYFVALLLSTFFMTSIQLGLSGWFAVLYHSDNGTFSDRGTHVHACIVLVEMNLHCVGWEMVMVAA